MKKSYVRFEVLPIVSLDNEEPQVKPEDHPAAFIWAVYGYDASGRKECLADGCSKETADFIQSWFVNHTSKPALIAAALLARKALEPRRPPDTLNGCVNSAVVVERAIRAIDDAVLGVVVQDEHILVPVAVNTVRRVFPDVDLGDPDSMEALQELIVETLPDMASYRNAGGMRI